MIKRHRMVGKSCKLSYGEGTIGAMQMITGIQRLMNTWLSIPFRGFDFKVIFIKSKIYLFLYCLFFLNRSNS